jgi:hypothetical protein
MNRAQGSRQFQGGRRSLGSQQVGKRKPTNLIASHLQMRWFLGDRI